jgi:NADPH:quinone reductase-like Zn-dependent oxidoreductase
VVQLAAAAGARVIATAHTDAERELVTRLGAHATVDHTGDLSSQVHEIAPDGVDAVAHLAGDQSSVELSVTEADSSPPWCKARTRCPRRPRP